MRRFLAVLAASAVVMVVWADGAVAHELSVATLTIEAPGPDGRRAASWSAPRLAGRSLMASPEASGGCVLGGQGPPTSSRGRTTRAYALACLPDADGFSLRLEGAEAGLIDTLVRVEGEGGAATTRLPPGEEVRIGLRPGAGAPRASAYLRLGTEHVLSGADHLAFVLALCLLLRGLGVVARTVTAFSVGHSLTLAAAALGALAPPARAVEALIALSVVLLAREAMLAARGAAPGLAARRPEIAALGIGLVHGLGFAGALSEIGLPEGARLAALLAFNLGVEAGQLLVVAAGLGVLALAGRLGADAPLRRVAAVLIGAIGLAWTAARVG